MIARPTILPLYDMTIAHIAEESGGVKGLYCGDKLVFSVDNYGDVSAIETFLCGIKFTGAAVRRIEIYISDEYVDNNDCPETLTALKEKWPEWTSDPK